MDESQLSERKKRILKAIIEAHIAYGEPVGSKYLAKDQQLACSSATIRNEMAELESMGYLEQPHTSAGRIPSEAGYRFYVNQLLDRYSMTAGEIAEINRTLRRKLNEMDQILAEASRLASNLTNYTAIAVKPRRASVAVTRFECLYVDSRNFILIMLFPGGTVKSKNIRLSVPVTAAQTALLGSLLNLLVAGKSADQFNLPLMLELENRLGSASALANPILKTIYETMSEVDGGDLRVEGVNRLLQYPEYADVNELRQLIDLFERKDELLDLVCARAESDQINICIGSENTVQVMNHSTLVFKTIRSGNRVLGAIGVIGPRRMDYGRVISTIDNLAFGIDHLLSDADNHTEKGALPPDSPTADKT